jgi:hypothetical protein
MAEQGRIGRVPGVKGMESAVEVAVVDKENTSGTEHLPSVVQLEQKVAPAVPAVMEEEVDALQLPKETRETTSTRSPHIRPSLTELSGTAAPTWS